MVNPQQNGTTFLSTEESDLVDAALLSTHEKFLTRITISSMRLLSHIAKDLDTPIEELSASQVIQWFEKDGKIRREQGSEAAFLKW